MQLRPSLRAAYRLNRRYGMGKLFHGVNDGNLGIMLDIAMEGGDPIAARSIIERNAQTHLGECVEGLKEPLFAFLAQSVGVDDDPKTDHPAEARAKAGEPFDLDKALTDFFEIATGWLGWSPADAWAATPGEIMVAQRGLVAKLRAINGVSEDKTDSDPREEVTPHQVKEGLATLRALSGGVS
ncbi:hypothetical protein NKJ10_00215 [Mesorhizobium sp. M0204]|uniref:hypothetical protein n=1 Tax=Mesorhizobium sp. M0204 TaxID=2956913 RepID=UPI0033393413